MNYLGYLHSARRMGAISALFWGGIGLTAMPASADTIVLYSVADAEITGKTLGSGVNTHNWGNLQWLTGNVNQTGGPVSSPSTAPLYFPNSGDSRGLFMFDLSSIPAGSTITSATISLYVGFNAFSPVSSRITSVSLFKVESSWTELGVTYDTRPTWNTTQVTSMTIPAGTGSGGSIPFNGYINGSGSGITNLVQGWLDGTTQNFGLQTSDTYTTAGLLRIYASERTGTNGDPKLSVTFTPPPFVVQSIPLPTAARMGILMIAGLVGARSFRRKN